MVFIFIFQICFFKIQILFVKDDISESGTSSKMAIYGRDFYLYFSNRSFPNSDCIPRNEHLGEWHMYLNAFKMSRITTKNEFLYIARPYQVSRWGEIQCSLFRQSIVRIMYILGSLDLCQVSIGNL